MNGPDQLLEATTALFRAPLWRLAPDHRYGLYAVEHPAAAGVMLPAGRGDRWLYAVMSKPGERLAQDLTETAMARSDLGGRIAHIWVPSDEGRASTLDLVGPGLTLFHGSTGQTVAGGDGAQRPCAARQRPSRRVSRRGRAAARGRAVSTSSRARTAVATSARSICARNGSWRESGSSARSACS